MAEQYIASSTWTSVLGTDLRIWVGAGHSVPLKVETLRSEDGSVVQVTWSMGGCRAAVRLATAEDLLCDACRPIQPGAANARTRLKADGAPAISHVESGACSHARTLS